MGINLLKGLFSGDEDIYGRKANVPTYDPKSSYQKTINDNLSLLPSASKLTAQTNQYNMDNLSNLYRQVFPQRDAVFANIGKNLEASTRGELPPDVLSQLQRNSAAYGVSSGTLGSGFNRNRGLRDLGLTSLDATRRGQADTSAWMDTLLRTSLPDPADVRDYAINPAARAEADWNNSWLKEQIAASPDPGERGMFDNQMALLGMVLSAYGGGPGYQGTYQPNNSGGNKNSGGGGSANQNTGWWSSFRKNTGMYLGNQPGKG